MSIYTKTGDQGTTALLTGQRVKKSHPRVEAYGTLDELNAALNLCTQFVQGDENRRLLTAIRHQLFYLSAELATEGTISPPGVHKTITDEHVRQLEQAIDRCMSTLPPLRGFILPGNNEADSRLHFARAVARRAERRLIELADQAEIRQTVLQYINRLSDCLYALACDEDHQQQLQQISQTVVARYLAACRRTAPPAPATKADELSFADVHQLLKLTTSAALELAVPVAVAVADRHGNMIMTYRMPNTLLVSSELAPQKAWTAVAMKTPTHQLTAAIQPGADLFQLEASLDGKVVTFGGGYPLWRNGQLIGGLGISGGSVEQDMHIAQAAVAALHLRKE